MHWHAYIWLGSGADLAREGERRPTSPAFPTSALPPMRTGDWLAKPATRIAETFDDVNKAAEWMAHEYARRGGTGVGVPIASRQALALHLLPRGVDVQWGEWLVGGRFITLGTVCCPNRHLSHPCPQGR